jgi:hypothetical protein
VTGREDFLREELEWRARREWPASGSEDFAVRLLREQNTIRSRQVETELADLVNSRLEIHLVPNERRHSVRTAVLGAILTRLQAALDYGAWAMEAGPAVAGYIPAKIRRMAATDVMAVAPGSVNVVVRKSELELSTSFEDSVEAFLDLAAVGDSGSLWDEAASIAVALGGQSTRRLELLFKKLG